ncbi:ABC transporter ATP-binding protein [Tenacibaculum sp. UWU-22]|uniref:ABC transporter ATP-binding protein n=1 Tax=Tenacibaculum sp. UWU-22 TaxID=3234187 RepID=UPI0034DB5BB8
MIEVKNLKKTYDNREALKGISLAIDEGEFYGLLGPNGAGKTTTISILSSILELDSGEVIIDNQNIEMQPKEVKKLIGVVPQEIALYEELSAYENLMFWGGLYEVPKNELSSRATELLKLFGLDQRKNDKIKNYSGGMKRRVNIASALLHQPKVLFMDEPTVGIDPQSKNLIFEVVEKLHKQGMTIVYTTHYMEEAERFCDRIGIIDDGKIIAEGTLDELRNSSSVKETIAITFLNLNDMDVKEISAFWGDMKQIENTVHFYSLNVKSDLSKLVLQCNQLGLEITNIEILKMNLETIFLKLTGKQLRD